VLIAFCSVKGAPGVTTTALALALGWPRPVVVAELDAAGGAVLAGYGRGELTAPGVADLALAARHGGLAEQLEAHLLRLDEAGRVRLLPGLADPVSARRIDWPRLTTALATLDRQGADEHRVDVLADCGRLGTEHFPAAAVDRAAVTVLVTGSTLRAVHAATHAVPALRTRTEGRPGRLGVLVVSPGEPYGAAEIEQALGVPVLGTLPRDPRSAAVLSDGAPAGRLFAQSGLMRAARTTAVRLRELAAASPSAAVLQEPAAVEVGGRDR
jgi:MinD-like ATPase involved in chromosome partitioning or flagellar assembly